MFRSLAELVLNVCDVCYMRSCVLYNLYYEFFSRTCNLIFLPGHYCILHINFCVHVVVFFLEDATIKGQGG